ncbi:MAG TPA: PH domain-containing protein, partial [Ornithinibacter sp.]|nr:PH domain-containing protein [Ornithinibacter sp.]
MTDPVPPPAPGEPDGWQRLHPLSPLLRGGLVLLAVLGYAASQLFDRVLASLGLGSLVPDDGIPDGGGDDPTEALVAHPLVALLLVLAVIGVVAGANWLSWRFSRFRVAPHQVELRQGILFRQHRQVPFERVQAVELSRPLLARLLGLAQVVVQSAGGSDSHLRLAFLSLARAEQLRDELLVRAGRSDEVAQPGPGPADGGPFDAADAAHPTAVGARPRGLPATGIPVLAVPNGRLFVATILHGSTIVLGALALAALGGTGFGRFGPVVLVGVPAMLPIAIGVAISRVKELLTHGNFSIADTGTGVRVQEGLTDLRTTTIPMHRIQALELVQPLWWRALGWWRIRVNVAGAHGGGDGDDSRETTLLPVGTLADALRVLGVVAPALAPGLWERAALGDGAEPGWRPVSRR